MNIYILCTNNARLETILIINKEFPIKGIIGLSKRKPTDKVSSYLYMKPFCKQNNINFTEVDNYSLKDEKDQKKLSGLNIDILLVLGWQRLIPEWLIEQCKIGTIGVHGSADGISGGRGRSPQNWALIMGKKKFYLSIFFIDKNIDSGKVIDTTTFAITEYDDIWTSYQKDSLMTAKMIVENIKNKNILLKKGNPQNSKATYLPQRRPEDGAIDWYRSTKEIYNFIRALAKPYPGAFCQTKYFKLVIWKAKPFNIKTKLSHTKPCKIIKNFQDKSMLIQTNNGSLLVTDYEIIPQKAQKYLTEGKLLPSINFKKQMQRIVNRHKQKYPNLTLSQDILKLSK